jgi:formate hydrogenlyase transcriptional activator
LNTENDILIVDDEIASLRLLTELLEKEGYRVRPTERAQTAIDAALATPPSLILLEVRLPEMDGFELCLRLKQDERTRHVPIIFVSALHDTEARINGFKAGGADFISKPFQELEILARVRTHIHLHRMQQHFEQLVNECTSELRESKASLEQKIREVQESEEHFRRLMEQSPIAIEILTPEGQISQVNTAWMRMWSLNKEETAQVLTKYNMLTDKQVKELGILPLVEKAFSGQPVVLPPIQYSGLRALADMKLKSVGVTSPWVQCHLFSVKNASGKIEYLVNTYVDISERKQVEIKLREALAEIEQLKNQLEAESAYLQEEIKLEHNFENIIGQSESMKYVLHRVEQIAPTDSPVIIMGETGTGKELLARALHKLSPRGKRALVKVNCAALPRELIESELFGREKGAFTGATTTQAGRFELAKGSTLFLDEIGELPIELQAKLLRVIESGEFERLGSPRTLHSDARIIAATNRALEEEVRKGRFREDLWYRLKVFPITLSPLREHPEDIPLLVAWFVDQLAREMGKRATKIPKRSMKMLQRYRWPGNVRELKHVVEAALITAEGKKLNFELPQTADTALSDFKSFEDMERDYILRVLKATDWKIGGKSSAASALGMHVNTLRSRMKKLGIKRPKPR